MIGKNLLPNVLLGDNGYWEGDNNTVVSGIYQPTLKIALLFGGSNSFTSREYTHLESV